MTDFVKTVYTFAVAIAAPWWVAAVPYALTGERAILFIVAVALTGYTLWYGYQRNNELENSVGAVFGQLTPWVIPAGVSWWVPRPFGSALQKTPVGNLEVNLTREAGKQLTMVETSDGAQVEVSIYLQFRIVNLLQWVRAENPRKALAAAIGQAARTFVGFFPSDGEESIGTRKPDFVTYLHGGKVDVGTEADPQEEKSDLPQNIMDILGVEIVSVRVDDINPPPAIVKAREDVAKEAAQARQESANILSVRHRMLELMWGQPPKDVSIEDYAQTRSAAGKTPLMDAEAARQTALAEKGTIRVLDVRGGGDFSRGAAIQTDQQEKRN